MQVSVARTDTSWVRCCLIQQRQYVFRKKNLHVSQTSSKKEKSALNCTGFSRVEKISYDIVKERRQFWMLIL